MHAMTATATKLEKTAVHLAGDHNKTLFQTVPELQVQAKDEERNTIVSAGSVLYGFTHTANPKKEAKNQYGTSSSQQPEKVM